MEKEIIYFSQNAKIGCDEKCNKAWGINKRPKLILDKNNPDNYVFLSDDELGESPINPGTYEGEDAKPTDRNQMLNKWCVRECERCTMSKPNEFHLKLEYPDYSKRHYNIPSKHQS